MKKLNTKNVTAPPPFKKTCPCTILPHPFLFFRFLSSGGGNRNLLPLPLKREGEVGPNYDHLNTRCKYILDASYIQVIVKYNLTAHKFLRAYDFFLLKLKICMDKNFLTWLFPDPLTESLIFPDLPDRVKVDESFYEI